MNHREPLEDWEKAVHQDLDALPELEAPSTLIPRVLSRIQAPEPSAWYRSSWWQWPLALRCASVALVIAALGALGWLSGASGGLGFGQRLANACLELKAALVFTMGTCETVLGSGAVFWGEHGQTILIAAAAFLLATYLTCVAAGSALYQLAWRRSS